MTPLGPTDWAALAKLAMLVRCGDARIEQFQDIQPRSGRDRFELEFSVAFAAVGAPSDPAELAEYLGLAYIEQAEELLAAADASSPIEWGLACPTCGAKQGAACEPIHAGERAPGRWCHPTRGERDLGTYARVAMDFARRVEADPIGSSACVEDYVELARGIRQLAAERQAFKAERFGGRAIAGGMGGHRNPDRDAMRFVPGGAWPQGRMYVELDPLVGRGVQVGDFVAIDSAGRAVPTAFETRRGRVTERTDARLVLVDFSDHDGVSGLGWVGGETPR